MVGFSIEGDIIVFDKEEGTLLSESLNWKYPELKHEEFLFHFKSEQEWRRDFTAAREREEREKFPNPVAVMCHHIDQAYCILKENEPSCLSRTGLCDDAIALLRQPSQVDASVERAVVFGPYTDMQTGSTHEITGGEKTGTTGHNHR